MELFWAPRSESYARTASPSAKHTANGANLGRGERELRTNGVSERQTHRKRRHSRPRGGGRPAESRKSKLRIRHHTKNYTAPAAQQNPIFNPGRRSGRRNAPVAGAPDPPPKPQALKREAAATVPPGAGASDPRSKAPASNRCAGGTRALGDQQRPHANTAKKPKKTPKDNGGSPRGVEFRVAKP